MSKYYSIMQITKFAHKFSNYLNDYEPYQEIREFRHFEKPFKGFSNNPIIFEKDKSYKNEGGISDFLVNDWGENIVSQKIYDYLIQNYGNEIDFYPCFVNEDGCMLNYYILRPKLELDVLDKKLSVMIDYGITQEAFKTIIIDNIPKNYNFFAVKNGESNVISNQLYQDLIKLTPTNFDVMQIPTTSEELTAREKILKKQLRKEDNNQQCPSKN